jgi:hypothetical protein
MGVAASNVNRRAGLTQTNCTAILNFRCSLQQMESILTVFGYQPACTLPGRLSAVTHRRLVRNRLVCAYSFNPVKLTFTQFKHK